MLSWCRTWPLNGSGRIRAKTKTYQEAKWSSQKFLEPNWKPKVIFTDSSLEFGKACEDISWNHSTSTPHRTQTNGIAERAVRRVKEGTSAVLLQSGLNESWWADSVECYTSAEHSRSLNWWEDSTGKTLWGTIYRTNHSVWFIGWVSPYNCEGSVKNPSVWKESLAWVVPRIRSVRGGNLEGWQNGLQTLRSWKRWTHRKSTQKDSMRKRW